MKKFKGFTLKKGQKLTSAQAKELFEDITINEQRLEIETRGPWGIISKCRGLAINQNFETGDIEVYGYRSLSGPRSSDYQLEGHVSIEGDVRSAFTSSHLFELENGHLIDVGVIFARKLKSV